MTRDVLVRLGFNVDHVQADWGTIGPADWPTSARRGARSSVPAVPLFIHIRQG